MSLSQYVIICKGRIDYATGSDTGAKIRALSDGAAFLLHHIEITQPGKLTETDTKPISDLQHYLMDHAADITETDLDLHAVEMFNYLDALEDKFEKSGSRRPTRASGPSGLQPHMRE